MGVRHAGRLRHDRPLAGVVDDDVQLEAMLFGDVREAVIVLEIADDEGVEQPAERGVDGQRPVPEAVVDGEVDPQGPHGGASEEVRAAPQLGQEGPRNFRALRAKKKRSERE